MESITKFLDPKSIPDTAGDDLDVDKALDKKSDLDADQDTIEINITNNVDKDKKSTVKTEKPKISDVVLPGKKETDDGSDSESSSETEDSGEVKSSETSKSDEKEKSAETEKSVETEKPADSGEEKKAEPAEKATDASAENESVVKESDEETEEEPVESGEGSEESADSAETPDVAIDTDEIPAEPVENDTTGLIAGTESDLEADQETVPLLRLVTEYDYHDAKVYELPNGAQIIYIKYDSPLCYCSFDFKVGSFLEDDSNRGVSHLLEHLMFNGCPGMSSVEFNSKLDKLGVYVNAFTDRLLTSFHFKGLKVNFIPAFDLYYTLISSFTPTDAIVDKERGVVLNEIGVYNDRNWSVLSEAIHSQAYRQHPIAHPILGYESVIEHISTDQVKEWYEKNYTAKNLTCYLVGDFPEEDLVYVADKLQGFRDGERNPDPVITDTMAMPFYKNVITHKEGVTQTLILSTVPFKNEGFNLYECNIMAEVLGGSMSSYLWKEFREDRSIAYEVGSYASNLDKDHLLVTAYAGLNNADDAELAKSIFRESFKYAKSITEEEFNKALNKELTALYTDEETESGLLSFVRDYLYLGQAPDEAYITYKNLTYDSYLTFTEQIDPDAMVTGILYPMDV